ncbi:MAG: hypothetical protein ABDH23_05305 [Endomicrobiia bacterium]
MNIKTILDEYIIDLNKKIIDENFKISLSSAFIIYLLALLTVSLAYSIIFGLNIFDWFSLMVTNLIFSIFVLILFLIWTSFISGVFKKSASLGKFLALVFLSHSSYFLLLPFSLICYRLNLDYLFSFLQFLLFLIVVKRILKYTKIYFKFNNLHMFFVIGLPALFIMFLILLPVLFLIFYFYSKNFGI